jgi:hypothetical protein
MPQNLWSVFHACYESWSALSVPAQYCMHVCYKSCMLGACYATCMHRACYESYTMANKRITVNKFKIQNSILGRVEDGCEVQLYTNSKFEIQTWVEWKTDVRLVLMTSFHASAFMRINRPSRVMPTKETVQGLG